MPTEVTDGVYDITCGRNNGSRYRAFLFTNGTPTLFDAGLENTVDTLVEGIQEIGTAPERLIITHGDPDHVGGFDGIIDRYDVTTWVPKQTDLESAHGADHRYEGGDVIGRFEAVYIPGHTSDHYALIDETDGIAVMGDAVSGADQRGLPAGHYHLPPAVYSENLNEAEENLESLLAYEFDTALLFHGSSVTENAREKLEEYVNFVGKP